jgi:hypothetical protein
MYIEKNEFNVITIEQGIKVFGAKGGYELFGKIDDMKNIAKGKKEHCSHYGLWIGIHPNEYYFIGIEVIDDEQSHEYTTFTVPEGKYIQNYFNAENIDVLLSEKCGKKYVEGENWAKQNNIEIDTSLFVEIYPEGMFDMEFPEMYYLCKVKE